MNPRFSIITVCFNAEKTIGQAIASLLKQKFTDFEYIVIDGASTDDTLNVVRDSCGFRATVVSEKDNGIYDAMNKGVSLACGDIIYFLNADDRFESDSVLQDISDGFNSCGQPDLLWGNVIYEYCNNSVFRSFRHINNKNLVFLDLNHQAVFAKRSLFQSFGSFDLSFRLNSDYDFLLRVMYEKAKFSWINVNVARFNAGGAHVHDREFLERERYKVRMRYISPLKFVFGALYFNLLHKINRFRLLFVTNIG